MLIHKDSQCIPYEWESESDGPLNVSQAKQLGAIYNSNNKSYFNLFSRACDVNILSSCELGGQTLTKSKTTKYFFN